MGGILELKKMKTLIVLWFKRSSWHFTGMLPKKLAKVVFVAGPCNFKLIDALLFLAVQKITKVPAKAVLDVNAVSPSAQFLLKLMNFRFINYQDPKAWIQIAADFKEKPKHVLLLCPFKAQEKHPEFTTTAWYKCCQEAAIPVAMIAKDESKTVLRFHGHFLPGKNDERDLKFVKGYYKPFFQSAADFVNKL